MVRKAFILTICPPSHKFTSTQMRLSFRATLTTFLPLTAARSPIVPHNGVCRARRLFHLSHSSDLLSTEYRLLHERHTAFPFRNSFFRCSAIFKYNSNTDTTRFETFTSNSLQHAYLRFYQWLPRTIWSTSTFSRSEAIGAATSLPAWPEAPNLHSKHACCLYHFYPNNEI